MGSRFFFSTFQKSQRIAILGLLAKDHELKNRLWGVDSFIQQLRKVKGVRVYAFSWTNREFDTLTP
jgi:hypothetical protein